jgi:hypothetical protein
LKQEKTSNGSEKDLEEERQACVETEGSSLGKNNAMGGKAQSSPKSARILLNVKNKTTSRTNARPGKSEKLCWKEHQYSI